MGNTRRTRTSPAPPAAAQAGHDAGSGDGRWTMDRIHALGATTDLRTAATIFGLSRNTAYELARRGQFPVPVLRVGARYRVPVPAILTVLGADTASIQPQPGRVDPNAAS